MTQDTTAEKAREQIAQAITWLETIREVVREAHWALDDSEDRTDAEPPFHAVPHENAMTLDETLRACENFAAPDEAWDGPGPLVTRVIDLLAALTASPAQGKCSACNGFGYFVTAPDTTSEGGKHIPCGRCQPQVTFGESKWSTSPAAIDTAMSATGAGATAIDAPVAPSSGEWIEREAVLKLVESIGGDWQYEQRRVGDSIEMTQPGSPYDRGKYTAAINIAAAIRALPRTPKPQELAGDVSNVVRRVLTDVCELPDRNSPDDDPDMLLITTDELETIVRRALGEDI